jgi:multisite-specific tRNA:(cytosine-C5)-methyltransferase
MFPSGKGYQDLGDSSCDVDMEDDITSVENGKAEDGVEAVDIPAVSESAEEVSEFPLEHCMRIMPHDQNTGAFFIAVLQKVSPLPGSVS